MDIETRTVTVEVRVPEALIQTLRAPAPGPDMEYIESLESQNRLLQKTNEELREQNEELHKELESATDPDNIEIEGDEHVLRNALAQARREIQELTERINKATGGGQKLPKAGDIWRERLRSRIDDEKGAREVKIIGFEEHTGKWEVENLATGRRSKVTTHNFYRSYDPVTDVAEGNGSPVAAARKEMW